MLYTTFVRFLKHPRGNALWRRWQARYRGVDVGRYASLGDYVRRFAPGKSFADVGCMWGVNGAYSFLAEECGATAVKGIDVFGPTPEFEAEKSARTSAVEFVLGDITDPGTPARVGLVDVVFCAGVLYHHPSPFEVLVALRRICRETLVLRTFAIPEVTGLPNAAVYFPYLKAKDRELWNLSSLGVPRQVGISDAFEPEEGYGNFFWGLTPSCLVSLLATAGFQVDQTAPEPFAQTFVCSPTQSMFAHPIPGEAEARAMGEEISAAGIARPA